jgi:hypothetical protein
MAVNWTYKIDVTNIPDKIANIMATRTVTTTTGTSPNEVITVTSKTYNVPLVSFIQSGKTIAQIRTEIINNIWAQYQAEKAKEDAINTLVSNQESLLAIATNAKEVV